MAGAGLLGPGQILQSVVHLAEGRGPAPVEQWNPDFCGDIDMEIRRDGAWYYMGTPISRAPMVRLFSTILRHDEDGKYYLVTPVEKVGIRVEETPFLAVSMQRTGEGEAQVLQFTTNVGDVISCGPAHPLNMPLGDSGEVAVPRVLVRGRLEAKMARPVYYDLVDMGVEKLVDGELKFGVWSGGVFFSLIAAEALS